MLHVKTEPSSPVVKRRDWSGETHMDVIAPCKKKSTGLDLGLGFGLRALGFGFQRSNF